jgi:hypothetical protein
MKKILSVDGGGIRGLFPTAILAEIEARTGKPISQTFDLLTGTSTGGLLVACLGKGMPAKDILSLYLNESKTIFDRNIVHMFLDHFGLIDSKYPADGIEGVLDKYLGTTTFAQASPYLLIPALNIQTGKPKFFKTNEDGEIKLSYAARASSAAPTYFPPKDYYVDGGMFANDPSACGLADAFRIWPGEQFKVLSIGTLDIGSGEQLQVSKGGLFDWAPKIVDLLINGNMGFAAYQVQHFLGSNYMRLQDSLAPGISGGIDNIDPINMKKIVTMGKSMFQRQGPDILKFLEVL